MTAGGPRQLKRPILCLITDRRRLPTSPARSQPEDALVGLIAAACDAAIDLVQIRERDMEGGALFHLTRRALDVAKGSPTRILVNDRLDVAIAAGAHGVHLRSDSIASSGARALAPPGFLIGRSVHSARHGGTGWIAGSGTGDHAAGARRGRDYPGNLSPGGRDRGGRVCRNWPFRRSRPPCRYAERAPSRHREERPSRV
jgi:hypothetical protein